MSKTVVSPLKLPKAPRQYDERDQDHTRRLIELAFGQFASNIQTVSNDVAGAAAVPQDWVPSSPVIACVNGVDTGAGLSPFFQILNPPSSGKYVIIYRINLLKGTGTFFDRCRITSQPVNLDGLGVALTSATAIRMDENDSTSIATSMRGAAGAPPFAVSQSCFVAQVPGATSGPSYMRYEELEVVGEDTQPIVLAPGDAFEYTTGTAGAGQPKGLFAIFDEIAVTSPLTNVALNETWRPINSIMSAVAVAAGNVATAQLLNPVSSAKKLRVTGVYIFTDFSGIVSSKIRMVRTRQPLTPSGTITVGLAKYQDGRTTGAINGVVRGFTTAQEGTGVFETDAASFFDDRSGASGQVGPWFAVVRPKSGPMFLKPGSALEVQAPDTNSALYCSFIWDEVSL